MYYWYDTMGYQEPVATIEEAIELLQDDLRQGSITYGADPAKVTFAIRSPMSCTIEEGKIVSVEDIIERVNTRGWCQIGAVCEPISNFILPFGGVESGTHHEEFEKQMERSMYESAQEGADQTGRLCSTGRMDGQKYIRFHAIPRKKYVRTASVWHVVSSHSDRATDPKTHTRCMKVMRARDAYYSDKHDGKKSYKLCKKCNEY